MEASKALFCHARAALTDARAAGLREVLFVALTGFASYMLAEIANLSGKILNPKP
jgi:hypothetical protein